MSRAELIPYGTLLLRLAVGSENPIHWIREHRRIRT
jgi:hypothetical protein